MSKKALSDDREAVANNWRTCYQSACDRAGEAKAEARMYARALSDLADRFGLDYVPLFDDGRTPRFMTRADMIVADLERVREARSVEDAEARLTPKPKGDEDD